MQLVVHRKVGSFVTRRGDPPSNESFDLVRGCKSVINDQEAGAASIELFPPLNPALVLADLAGFLIDLMARDLDALEIALLSGTTSKIAFNVPIQGSHRCYIT